MTEKEGKKFQFSRRCDEGFDRRLQRFLQWLPGTVSWLLLAGMVALSHFKPAWALVFIVVFATCVFFRFGQSIIILILSTLRLRIETDTDWMARVLDLDKLGTAESSPLPSQSNSWFSQWLHQRKLKKLEKRIGPKNPLPRSESIHQVIVVPIVNEDRKTLEHLFETIREQSFPNERTMVVLAVQDTAARQVKRDVWTIQRDHFDHFLAIYVAPHHSDGNEQEIARTANLNGAARIAVQALREREIPLDQTILTCLEPTSEIGCQYLACVAWHFMTCADRDRVTLQPLLPHRPGGSKTSAPGSIMDHAAFLLHSLETDGPDSPSMVLCQSTSCEVLERVGHWSDDMEVNDATFFWKCYLTLTKRFRIVTIPTTVSPAHAKSGVGALERNLRDRRRAASAVADFPVILRGLVTVPGIPIVLSFYHGVRLFLGHIGRAVWVPNLLVVGWLPWAFATLRSSPSSLSYYALAIQLIISGAVLAVLLAGFLVDLVIPISASKRVFHRSIVSLFAWLLLPVISIIFSAFPHLAAQSRLVRGGDRRRI